MPEEKPLPDAKEMLKFIDQETNHYHPSIGHSDRKKWPEPKVCASCVARQKFGLLNYIDEEAKEQPHKA